MSLLIRNGEVVTDTERIRADVLCEGERIARVGPGLSAPANAEIINAEGKYVFPGFVDPHVHVYLPLKTTCSKDTYETASVAALAGGTTCIIDFCSPERDELPLDALAKWEEQSRGRSACDYSFHMAVTRFDPEVAEQLREVIRRGISSLKIYLAYKDSVALAVNQIEQLMAFAAREGVLVLGHCEDADEVDRLQKELVAAGKTGPEWHYHSRPPAIEAMGTRRFLEIARDKGARAYVVHLSCEEALKEAVARGGLGERVWIETLISFLLLDKTYAEKADFEGAKYIVSPPLRERRNQEVLWKALADGTISTLATDHAPFDFGTQKQSGRKDFRFIPNGMPTLEDRINLLCTYGVKAGKLGLNRMVEVASSNPARLFGLYPRKGAIRAGSDADLVVYDPACPGTISAKTHHMNVDYNPFEGWKIAGRPSVVTVRGEVAFRDGLFVGTPGRGAFVPRPAGR
ncbi:MAG: D-hydantoinase [Verrucomicrobia bacterium ADurb.Bin345]|nr:MAG: D-hydantoinase [Verrucomicrobia bacterium ADurb.Bin345]